MSHKYGTLKLAGQFAETKIFLSLVFTILILITSVRSAHAANYIVSNTNDSGAGSLRQAINDANALTDADTIVFASPLFDSPQTINLTSGQLFIINPLTITGKGAALLTVRRAIGNPTNFRVFQVVPDNFIASVSVSISGMTISNGNDVSGNGGGGIFNFNGTLILTGVTISGNVTSTNGGGIFQTATGTTTILNSTINNNTASTGGGGIKVFNGIVNIANSTVSGNTVVGTGASGGGIDNQLTLNMNNVTITNNTVTTSSNTNAGGVFTSGTVNSRNTIIAGNTGSGVSRPDVYGAFTSQGNNLIGNTSGSIGFTQPTDKVNVAPSIGGLANNGGQTLTHLPNAGSPAIDAGDNCVVAQTCVVNNPPVPLNTDQRGAGYPRLNGTAVDIGAVESAVVTASEVSVSGKVVTPEGRGLYNVAVTLTDLSGATRTARTSPFGYFQFENIPAGQTVVIAVASKTYTFNTQVINLNESLSDVIFTGELRK